MRQLDEPEFTGDQRLPLRLSSDASNVARNPNNARMRRVRGPAGCGKSLGLATRAVALAQEGKDVLVVTFNVTLVHYLQDLCAREARSRRDPLCRRRITFTHFHGLCRDLIDQHDANDGWQDNWTSWAVRRLSDLYAQPSSDLPTYDAILVDEGQDFELEWWALLRDHLLRPEGEMLLAADRTQNLYARSTWTEDGAAGGGFSGPWADLKGTYRMPVDLVLIVREFAQRYLAGSEVDLPSVEPDHPGLADAHTPTVRRWVNALEEELEDKVAECVQEMLDGHPDLHPSDIVVLADHGVGVAAVDALRLRGHTVADIFDIEDSRRRQRKKRRFWAGSPGIKGCTVHSFKGWEARAVVAVAATRVDTPLSLYVAMTRVKGDPQHRAAYLTVVNALPDLAGFQAGFEREITPKEVPELAGQQVLEL